MLGASEEDPTRFTVRDWHPLEGQVIWQQGQLADDHRFINGHWAVDVARAGRYEIRLSRYPEDEEKPMHATEARIAIGPRQQTKTIPTEAGSVSFELDLPAGPALLQTALKDARTGKERGAYFIRARWLARHGSTPQR